jgi:Kelch motif
MWGRVNAVALAIVVGLLLVPAGASAAGSGSFSPTGSLGTPRYGPATAPLPDGRVLVAGGWAAPSTFLSSAEIYNPATSTFSPTGDMTVRRALAVAAPLPDGRVLVAGGYDGTSGVLYRATAEVFNPATGTFSAAGIGAMGSPRSSAVAAPLPDGRVLVAGGHAGGAPFASAEIFNPATNVFSPAAGSMTTPRERAAAAPLPDGRVLVAGGYSGSLPILASAEVFSPQTNTFSAAGIGSMVMQRLGPAAAPLPDGRVLVAGGDQNDGKSAEVFNPSTSSFSSAGIGSLSTARELPGAARLPDGRVLMAGGAGADFLASSEIFAATNSFSFTVQGKRLIVSVEASGSVSVVGPGTALRATPAKKKKRRRPALRGSSGAGDPPAIVLGLRLNKVAKQKLKRRGKVTLRARITFAPQGGLANSQTANLRIVQKKKKKKRK